MYECSTYHDTRNVKRTLRGLFLNAVDARVVVQSLRAEPRIREITYINVHEYNTSVSYFCTNSKYCISLRLEEIDNTLFVVQCTLKMKVKTHTKFERTTHRFFQLFTLPPCLKSQPAISGSPGGDIRRFAGLSMAPPSPPAGGGLDFFAGTGS